MRFVLSLLAIVLALFVGAFAEHDFKLIDGARHHCCCPCEKDNTVKKCPCEAGKCGCCTACPGNPSYLGKDAQCNCPLESEDGKCNCCEKCPGHK